MKAILKKPAQFELRRHRAEELLNVLTARFLQFPQRAKMIGKIVDENASFFLPKSREEAVPVAGLALREAAAGQAARITIFTTDPNVTLSSKLQARFADFEVKIEERHTGFFKLCLQGGDSVGYGVSGGATGTLGCVVKDSALDEYALSCNHVIANENSGTVHQDEVWSPGSKNGGTNADRIGLLNDFEMVRLGGILTNEMDAAIAKLDTNGGAVSQIRTVGTVAGLDSNPGYNSRVQKQGYRTKHTTGELTFKNMSLLLPFAGGNALFVNQYGLVSDQMGVFADTGDSGALVLNMRNEAVGLIMAVAGTGEIAAANPIDPVLKRFGVSF